MPAELQLSLLGTWALRAAGSTLQPHLREQRVLAFLALRGPQSRSALAGLLWPDRPEHRARGSLRTSLRHIRHEVAGVVRVGRDHVELSDEVTVDVQTLRATLDRVEQDPGAVASTGTAVLQLLRAPELLTGWYDEWVIAEREHLRHRRVRALMTLAALSFEDGAAERSISFARQAVELDPLLESAAALHIKALLLDGDLAAALAEYRRFRDRLRRELGIAPPRSLTDLLREAKASRSARASARGPLAAPAGPTGHPRHRR